MANLSSFLSGGGAIEAGQFVGTIADTLSGKAVLSCSGESFSSVTYPDLAAVVTATPLVASATELLQNPAGASSASNFDPKPLNFLASEDLTKALVSCTDSGLDLNVGYYTDLDTTPVTVYEDIRQTSINRYSDRTCISADGTKGFVAYADNTTFRCAYIDATPTIATSIISGSMTFNDVSKAGADIHSDGGLGIAHAYDTSASGNLKMYYTLSGGQIWTSVPATTGLSSSTQPVASGLVEGTNEAYVADGANFGGANSSRLYYKADVTTADAWVEVAQYPTLFQSSTSTPAKLYVSTADNLLYVSKSNIFQVSVSQLFISSDGGVNFDECTTNASFTDYLGNAASALILDVVQSKTDSSLLYLVRITNQLEGNSNSFDVYIKTTDRSPDWLNSGVLPAIFANAIDPSVSLPYLTTNRAGIMGFNPAGGGMIGITRTASTNTPLIVLSMDVEPAYYTPSITNTKIVAES